MSLAFVFPGQGSQSIGMLDAMAAEYSIVKETFQQASEVLAQDLWAMVSAGPQEALNQTENTQPVMLAAGVAVWRVWRERGGEQPIMMAGHSLGEYAALVCAGSLDFTDAITLVRDRGQFMQSAVPAGQGAMAAILGLEDDAVRALCEQAAEGEVLSAVNFNSPGQVVIAGAAVAVERAVAQASEAGAKRAVTLPVSVPSHCALMHPAAENMATRMAGVTIHPPSIRVVHNVDVSTHNEADAIRAVLVQQIERPVRWAESVQYLVANGVERIIECGPGRVLMGLNKRITKDAKTVAVYDPSTLDKALAESAP